MTIWMGQVPENDVWHIIDTAKYFDFSTLEQIHPFNGGIASFLDTGKKYSDEAGLVMLLRNMRDLIEKHKGEEEARENCSIGNFMGAMIVAQDARKRGVVDVRQAAWEYASKEEFDYMLKIYRHINMPKVKMQLVRYLLFFPVFFSPLKFPLSGFEINQFLEYYRNAATEIYNLDVEPTYFFMDNNGEMIEFKSWDPKPNSD